eukprot:CAMPEP_0172319532 /NCGR_PEP_ID=MMETSP1058-20130122/37935_1 /TAXON_ID=83371 /ORGANISM="Detonula confervacea, Strain CCMP 353" /LENGTH=205 /DNA_ID=CAMNT_0013034603 /DNA_START=26 /DNA_END=643 /DNA_ORIENTATION=+
MGLSYASASAYACLLLACVSYANAFSTVTTQCGAPPSSPSALHMTLQQLDDSNMKDLLFQPSEGKAVLVDAYAPWCGPCKLIEPYLDECAKKYSDQLSVIKYDVEGNNNKDLKVEMLLQGVMVRGLPTLLLYNDGIPLATHSGAIKETELHKWLEDNLSSKMDELEPGNAKQNEGPPQEEVVNDDATGTKRGFVSFGFEKDDYSL